MNVGPGSSLVGIYSYVVLMGLGIGSWLPTMAMLTSSNFGLVSYGSIFGTITIAHAIGCAAGPLIAGIMYDTMNTYRTVFPLFIALYVIAILVISALPRPRFTT